MRAWCIRLRNSFPPARAVPFAGASAVENASLAPADVMGFPGVIACCWNAKSPTLPMEQGRATLARGLAIMTTAPSRRAPTPRLRRGDVRLGHLKCSALSPALAPSGLRVTDADLAPPRCNWSLYTRNTFTRCGRATLDQRHPLFFATGHRARQRSPRRRPPWPTSPQAGGRLSTYATSSSVTGMGRTSSSRSCTGPKRRPRPQDPRTICETPGHTAFAGDDRTGADRHGCGARRPIYRDSLSVNSAPTGGPDPIAKTTRGEDTPAWNPELGYRRRWRGPRLSQCGPAT